MGPINIHVPDAPNIFINMQVEIVDFRVPYILCMDQMIAMQAVTGFHSEQKVQKQKLNNTVSTKVGTHIRQEESRNYMLSIRDQRDLFQFHPPSSLHPRSFTSPN